MDSASMMDEKRGDLTKVHTLQTAHRTEDLCTPGPPEPGLGSPLSLLVPKADWSRWSAPSARSGSPPCPQTSAFLSFRRPLTIL